MNTDIATIFALEGFGFPGETANFVPLGLLAVAIFDGSTA